MAEKLIDDMTDEALAAQPVGYWTGVAYQEVIAFLRRGFAEAGTSQPQYWILRHLSDRDLSEDGAGLTEAELAERMRTYLRAEDDIPAEARRLVERGWVRRHADERLWLTPAGEEARVSTGAHAPAWRAAIHEGIDDADYVTTLKVLRRMIRNVGGAPA